MRKIFLLCVFIFQLFIQDEALTCSIFSIQKDNQTFIGRNFDWNWGHGLVIVNQRGLKKQALVKAPNVPAQWTSKYGSVTFNQVGDQFPYGGMNEAGLTLEVLELESTQFPEPTQQPSLNELQWVQYQLDNYASINEVIHNLDKLNIVRSFGLIHYFVCDKNHECAVIEAISGKLVVHSGKELPVLALTNNTYEDSLNYADSFSNQQNKLPAGTKSLARFTRLKYLLLGQNIKNVSAVKTTFSYLDNVSSKISNRDDDKTQWQIVYSPNDKVIYFKTEKNNQLKYINLNKLKFSCNEKKLALDVNSNLSGDVIHNFSDYSSKMNAEIVKASLLTGFEKLPLNVIEKMTNYPSTFICSK